MARKKVGQPEPTTREDDQADPVLAEAESAPELFEVVKVNNANLTELKIALDDAVRRFFARPEQFRTRHTHTDVRLVLGWSSVLVAAITGFYGWKTEFEESKLLVFVGVVIYFALTAAQTIYAYYVEGKTIYVGKRKTLDHRIETEHLTVASESKPSTQSSTPPQYALTLSYTRSHGGGKQKTIIRKSSSTQERSFTTFFDGEGTLDEAAFTAWLREFSGALISSDKNDAVKTNGVGAAATS